MKGPIGPPPAEPPGLPLDRLWELLDGLPVDAVDDAVDDEGAFDDAVGGVARDVTA